MHDAIAFLAGAAAVLALQGGWRVAGHLVRLRTKAAEAEALRVAAEKRARDAEDQARLAELDAARLGAPKPEPVKRVTARPVR